MKCPFIEIVQSNIFSKSNGFFPHCFNEWNAVSSIFSVSLVLYPDINLGRIFSSATHWISVNWSFSRNIVKFIILSTQPCFLELYWHRSENNFLTFLFRIWVCIQQLLINTVKEQWEKLANNFFNILMQHFSASFTNPLARQQEENNMDLKEKACTARSPARLLAVFNC